MEIYFYKAQCGDASRITFIGDDNKYHHIFIDAGYERTFRNILSGEIADIYNRDEKIDLWVISHIHDDHIGGIINYISAINKNLSKDVVLQWWYNPPRIGQSMASKVEVSKASGIAQGDILTTYLESIGKLLITPITTEFLTISLHGLQITVLSPSFEKLKKLHKKYEDKIPLEKIEDFEISEAKAGHSRDYHLKVDQFDFSFWQEDSNVDNGSSIAILTTLRKENFLWLADAHPSTIVESLKRLGYSSSNRLICNCMKVAHHGSAGNSSDELYSLIECRNYIMSVASENNSGLPTKQSMIRILKNATRDIRIKYTFYFTYDDLVLRSIFAIDSHNIFESLNFEIIYLSNSNAIKFSI